MLRYEKTTIAKLGATLLLLCPSSARLTPLQPGPVSWETNLTNAVPGNSRQTAPNDQPAGAWGFFAHKLINRAAVFRLPKGMIRFYKNNLDYLTERAVNADKRRYVIAEEAPRHYFDTENYPDSILTGPPMSWQQATELFGEEQLLKNGTLPWTIIRVSYALSTAFQEGDSLRILRYSADLGHYLADAHVPLHTSANYDGQLSGQKGIHAFWESLLPELYAGSYDLFTGKASYIPGIADTVWKIIFESHRLVETTLAMERKLSMDFPEDQKYSIYLKNNQTTRNYSRTYAAAYRDALQGMVEERLSAAVRQLGNFWYTAWINAGQPRLENMEQAPLSAEDQHMIKIEEEAMKKWHQHDDTHRIP